MRPRNNVPLHVFRGMSLRTRVVRRRNCRSSRRDDRADDFRYKVGMILRAYITAILTITAASLAAYGLSPGFVMPSAGGLAALVFGALGLGFVLGLPLLAVFALLGHSLRRRAVNHPGVWALAGLVAGLIAGLPLLFIGRLPLIWLYLAGGEMMALSVIRALRKSTAILEPNGPLAVRHKGTIT